MQDAAMRSIACLLALCAAPVPGQPALPPLEGETLSGRKVSLPAATGGRPALLIIGFSKASQSQTKAWSQRANGRLPCWSVAVLEDVPRLLRGMVARGI